MFLSEYFVIHVRLRLHCGRLCTVYGVQKAVAEFLEGESFGLSVLPDCKSLKILDE